MLNNLIMKEQLVSFSTAKLAKEKGFDWKVLDTFASDGMPVSRYAVNEDGLESYITTGDEHYLEEVMELSNSEMQSDFVARPTQSLLQKWLRDEHKIHVDLRVFFKSGLKNVYKVRVYDSYNLNNLKTMDIKFNNYEEALEFGLKQSLEIL